MTNDLWFKERCKQLTRLLSFVTKEQHLPKRILGSHGKDIRQEILEVELNVEIYD